MLTMADGEFVIGSPTGFKRNVSKYISVKKEGFEIF
jgi:hypothetical protein